MLSNIDKNLKQRIYDLVATIPRGKIMSYGQIASQVGTTARIVGFLLSNMNGIEMDKFPWQRVVNKDGFISAIKLGEKGKIQEAMLKAEGIEIQECQIISPEKYWFYKTEENKNSLF